MTAVVDDFAERLEAHELQVWTYRRGQLGAGQQILPKETIHVWVKIPLEPRAFTGGGAGEVVLEWPGWGGNGIQRWQYRYKSGHKHDWGAWADVPNSGRRHPELPRHGTHDARLDLRLPDTTVGQHGPWSDLCGDRWLRGHGWP